MSVVLRCTDGPLAGERIAVDGGIEFGRECRGQGALGGDARLSRRHASVAFDADGRPTIEDLGSTNGTWINGTRIDGRRLLGDGDRLVLGRSRFQVELEPTTMPDGAATVAKTAVEQPRFRVRAGPLEGTEIPVGEELLIGRSFGEPGALGGDRLLSRQHARVSRGPDGTYFVVDSGSTNGTRLNDVQLRRTHALLDGDVLDVGASKLEALGFPAPPGGEELRYQSSSAIVPQGAAPSRLSSRVIVGTFAAVFAVAVGAAVAAVVLAAPLGSSSCAQGFVCQVPPRTPPLRDLATFSGALGWRVEYDASAAAPLSESAAGNKIVLTESNAQDQRWGLSAGSKLVAVVIRAFPAAQVSPSAALQQAASNISSNLLATTRAPNSDAMFTRPELGFHPAIGEVLEGELQTPQGPGGLQKVAVLAATSGNVTIAAAVAYPVQQGQTQRNNPDQPLDQFGDAILETVRFPDDGAT